MVLFLHQGSSSADDICFFLHNSPLLHMYVMSMIPFHLHSFTKKVEQYGKMHKLELIIASKQHSAALCTKVVKIQKIFLSPEEKLQCDCTCMYSKDLLLHYKTVCLSKQICHLHSHCEIHLAEIQLLYRATSVIQVYYL